jgi:hypothetical protein
MLPVKEIARMSVAVIYCAAKGVSRGGASGQQSDFGIDHRFVIWRYIPCVARERPQRNHSRVFCGAESC